MCLLLKKSLDSIRGMERENRIQKRCSLVHEMYSRVWLIMGR